MGFHRAALQLTTQPEPRADFLAWCESELKQAPTQVDVPTFVSFLQEIDADQVLEYATEFLGDNRHTRRFAANFVERRAAISRASQAPASSASPAAAQAASKPTSGGGGGRGRKKKKGGFAKVDQSLLLGFSVKADSGITNRGELELM